MCYAPPRPNSNDGRDNEPSPMTHSIHLRVQAQPAHGVLRHGKAERRGENPRSGIAAANKSSKHKVQHTVVS
jgi:hypothetical protein